MIQDFFKTIQSDVTLICNYVTGHLEKNEYANMRLQYAALRLFAALGIAASCYGAISAIRSTTVLEALTKSVAAVAVYVLSHDAFVMSKNITDLTSSVTGLATGIFHVIKDNFENLGHMINGDTEKVKVKFSYTKDTILRPIWDELLAFSFANV